MTMRARLSATPAAAVGTTIRIFPLGKLSAWAAAPQNRQATANKRATANARPRTDASLFAFSDAADRNSAWGLKGGQPTIRDRSMRRQYTRPPHRSRNMPGGLSLNRLGTGSWRPE